MGSQNDILDIDRIKKGKLRSLGRSYLHGLEIPGWAPYFLIISAVIVLTGYFLWHAPSGVPMGDSYIHFVYARNLVNYGEFAYNPGIVEGVGSTSFLWVITLAIFFLFGISPVIASKILGISLLAVSGCLVFDLAQKCIPIQFANRKMLFAAAFALLAIIPGSMIWLALSGMETMLFLTLGLLSVWLYSRERWISLGVTLGLLALTRIEGVILAGVLVMVEVLRNRRISLNIVKFILPMLMLLTPWLVYMQIREGMPIPSSFLGRKIVISELDKILTNEFPKISWLLRVNPLVFAGSWLYFTLLYITGSFALPGPMIPFGKDMVGIDIAMPLTGILVSSLVCLPLIFLAIKHIQRGRHNVSLHEPGQRLLIVIFSWVLLHNLAYALFLPQTGAAGRYVPMNHMLFWIFLFIGLTLIRNRIARVAASFILIGLVGLSIYYWFVVYQSNINFLLKVRKPAAEYIDEHYPPDTRIGATDLGPIGYFARQPVVDLAGHINKEFAEFYHNGGSFSDYLLKDKLCYLMLFDSIDAGELDIAKILGYYDDKHFDLIEEASFAVSTEEWKVGNEPLRNYLPKVSIFQVVWHNRSTCVQSQGNNQ